MAWRVKRRAKPVEIRVLSPEWDTDELIEKLESGPEWPSTEIRLEQRKSSEDFRVLETAILVAIISAGGTALASLITGLLSIAREGKRKRVILKDKTGLAIEIPADYPTEKVTDLLPIIQTMRGPGAELV
jgi:hypothetical protein